MTFREARDLAIEYSCRLPKFEHTSPLAQGWIDRVEWLVNCEGDGDTAEAIAECNRYLGFN